ncbi:MAG: GAF domain-containing protein [Blastocatellia bacterium]
MEETAIGTDMVNIFAALSEIPLKSTSRKAALKRVTELGQQAMGSHTCTLAEVDLRAKTMFHAACTSSHSGLEAYLTGKEFCIGTSGEGNHLHFDVIKPGAPIELYDLQTDGKGVANPEFARRYGFTSLLSLPLHSDGELIGYVNHFSSRTTPFSKSEKKTLEVFATVAMITITHFDQNNALRKSLDALRDLSDNLTSQSSKEFLQAVSDKARELLDVHACIIWHVDPTSTDLRVLATSGKVDDEYRKLTIPLSNLSVKRLLAKTQASYIRNARASQSILIHADDIIRQGWVSILSAPMRAKDDPDGRPIGMIDLFTSTARRFRPWEKLLLETFANEAAVYIQKADLTERAKGRRKLQELTNIMLQITEEYDTKNLWELLLDGALRMVGAEKGGLRLLDHSTGELKLAFHRGGTPVTGDIPLGKGLTGKALQEERAILVGDVNSEEWRNVYLPGWPNTISEMVVPILVTRARIRVGEEINYGSKPMGVLIIDGEQPNAYTEMDKDCLSSLARCAGLIADRIEFDRRLHELREIEGKILQIKDSEEIIRIVLKGITEGLMFDYVNISVVAPELNCIRTEYVTGLTDADAAKFKKMAVHSLDSDDIQADIVRNKKIEVPEVNDERFDSAIAEEFHHDQLVRVFMPMVDPFTGNVIGTLEAGYRIGYRKHIYDRDVELLESFMEHIIQALSQRKSGLLDQVTHEFRAPIVGIRNNASYIQLRTKDLADDQLRKKFDEKIDDVIADCAILLRQVEELEYILGQPRQGPNFQRCVVFRDVVIKTIHQLRSVISGVGLDPNKVEYKPSDAGRVVVQTDPARLNQVVYNLLINAIKYAEADPQLFTIRIDIYESREFFTIRFRDWGIGINKGYEERVFDHGFRTPEAAAKDVNGSGLGLTISKSIMRELNGDLRLASRYKPTEFHIILPKTQRRLSNDSDR